MVSATMVSRATVSTLVLVATTACGAGTRAPTQGDVVPIESARPPTSPAPLPEPTMLQLKPDEVTPGPDGLTLKLSTLYSAYAAAETPWVEVEVELARGEKRGRLALSVGRSAPQTRTWCGFRITLVDASEVDELARVSVGGTFLLAPVKRVKRDVRVALGDGLDITFTRHGHKDVMAGGPPSPLIVRFVHHRPDGDVDGETRVQMDESRLFALEGYLLELVGHEYDAWMDLRMISTP